SPFLASTVAQPMVMKLDGGGDTGGYSCAQTFSTVGNPDEPGEPIICDQNSAHPGWYTYVTPASGSLLIHTEGSTFNTVLGTFVGPGDSFATLTNIGCGDTTNYHVNGQPAIYIPNVPAGQTNYIVVEGENGASGTVHLHILLGDPVSITAPPKDQAAPAGSNVTLSVVASGATPLSYNWLYAGSIIAGATNSTLTISTLQASLVGPYTVMVSNLVSQDSAQATVSLILLPEITNQPASQCVSPGSDVTFTCAASSSVPVTYQWQIGSVVFPATTNTCLTLTNVQMSDAGNYVCIVSNEAGTVTSSNAVLTIQTAPSISTQPISQTVAPGATATLSVSATGTPAPVYQWFMNGAALGDESSSLAITNFQAANQGTYSVILSNDLGVVTSTPALLLLNGPCRIDSFASSNGAFSLETVGVAGGTYTIEATADLINWIPLFTNYTPSGFLDFTDTNAAAAPFRFYRAMTNSP
ncbi:MAG TPA: immunoglobulin domain-containing protein, partial [Candidatus Cybelea sp.]|nr:immunoglobulin domain-containing protein [Candidatus Cybelea sp.]